MKHAFFSLHLVLALVQPILAQSGDKYTAAMQATISRLDSLKQDPADWAQAAARFEMISNTAAQEWLPRYYAAYALTMQSYLEKDAAKRDLLVEKAEALWKQIPVETDETHVLRAWIAQANMAIDGRNRWKTQGAILSESLEKAKKLNPDNPRALLIEADGLFYKPKMFGGGPEKARPMYEQAVAAYEKFVPASPLHPTWGKAQAARQLAACQ